MTAIKTTVRNRRIGYRPRHLMLLCLPSVALVLVLGVWLLWPRSAINLQNAARIQKGMTPDEVARILGGPPRDETLGDVWTFENSSDADLLQGRQAEWIGPDCAVWITFTDGRVSAIRPGARHVHTETLLNTARHWLVF
jgi:hypothetical protein